MAERHREICCATTLGKLVPRPLLYCYTRPFPFCSAAHCKQSALRNRKGLACETSILYRTHVRLNVYLYIKEMSGLANSEVHFVCALFRDYSKCMQTS